MKKRLCHLLALSFLFICGNISAQTDSGYFDLGRIKLRKDFTQHITIKGSDLEHMPFARISDAIAPWLHGTLSTRPNLVFVVDGNLVNSVDAWSIQDIEEITLIQNSLVQVSGSQNFQQLVLVKTKRNQSSPKGITVAGSSYLANTDMMNSGFKSENNFYHQYHVGAWQNRDKISFGASANWLRDVFPFVEYLAEINKPQQLNRFHFNGWAEAKLAEGHSLSVGLNVVPQTISYNYTSTYASDIRNDDGKRKSTTINPSIHLSNQFAKGWLHELDFSYFTNRSPQDSRLTSTMVPPATGKFESVNHTVYKYNNALLRDKISYTHMMGQWQLQPGFSFSYRSTKQQVNYRNDNYTNGALQNTSTGAATFKGASWVLAPAISLSWRNAFSIAGGISAKLKENNGIGNDRIYPFFTTMVDLLRIGEPGNRNSLKLFGSFAKAGDFLDSRFQQQDLQYDPDPVFSTYPYPVYGSNVLYTPYPEKPTMQGFQGGAVFSLPEDIVQLSYNYDNRRYAGQLLVPTGGGMGYDFTVYHPDFIYSTHRLGIMTRVVNKNGLRWLSGINFTGFKYELKDEDAFPYWKLTPDANNDKLRWTGGFTNRLQYKNFSFGLDILYLLNEQRYFGADDFRSTNTLRLNNVYAGYSLKNCTWQTPGGISQQPELPPK